MTTNGEEVEAWLEEMVHQGYGSMYGSIFVQAGYTSVKQIGEMNNDQVREITKKLKDAGAQAADLRLIQGKITNLNAPEALPTAMVVVPSEYPAANISPQVPHAEIISLLPNGEAIQIPVAQVIPGESPGLERIFLGMGWKERNRSNTGTVDVDSSVTGFANGTRLAEHTVSYLKLHNATENQIATIVHTGDILVGQADHRSPSYDLERIYVDLLNLPLAIDALALEANIFTTGLTFDAIASAYVRLVNADTNQELARMSLDTLGAHRVALFARLFRVQSSFDPNQQQANHLKPFEWHLFADFQLQEKLFRHSSSYQPSMRFQGEQQYEYTSHEPPLVPPAEQKLVLSLSSSPPAETSQAKRKTYSMVPIAVASAAGVAASLAIFANAGNLTAQNFEPSQFSRGVDYASAADLIHVTPEISNCCLDACFGALHCVNHSCSQLASFCMACDSKCCCEKFLCPPFCSLADSCGSFCVSLGHFAGCFL